MFHKHSTSILCAETNRGSFQLQPYIVRQYKDKVFVYSFLSQLKYTQMKGFESSYTTPLYKTSVIILCRGGNGKQHDCGFGKKKQQQPQPETVFRKIMTCGNQLKKL